MAHRTINGPTATLETSASMKISAAMPSSGIQIGDALVAIVEAYGASSTPQLQEHKAWTRKAVRGQNVGGGTARYTAAVYAHYCDGSENNKTFDFEVDANTTVRIAHVFHIPGWHNNLDRIEAAISTSSTNTSHDPASFAWSWGSDDVVVIQALAMLDDDAGISAYPTGYSNPTLTQSGQPENSAASMASCLKQVTGTAEDAVAWTTDQTEAGMRITVAIGSYVTRGSINSPGYLVKNLDNDAVYYSLTPTTARDIFSMTKLMAAAVLRDNKTTPTQMNETTTVVTGGYSGGEYVGDLVGGTGNILNAGDVISMAECLEAMLKPSSNSATVAASAYIGTGATHNDRVQDFIAKMNALGSTLSLSTPVGGWASPDGFSNNNQVSPNDMFTILKELIDDPVVTALWSAPTGTVTVDRSGSTDIAVDHTLQHSFLSGTSTPALGGKTGGGGTVCRSIVWTLPSGDRVAFVFMAGTNSAEQNADVYHFIKQVVDNYPALLTPPGGGGNTLAPAVLMLGL